MILGFGNNITSKLASDINSLQTNIPINPDTGVEFAKLLTTDMTNTDTKHQIIAKVTFSNSQQTAWEICHLTAVEGDNLTVIRGQEGTVARNWKLGI